MELAAAALSSVLPKLAALREEDVWLPKAARGEIRFVQAELEAIYAFIRHRREEEPAEAIHVPLLSDLRELSYDIEDSVDGLMIQMKHEPVSKLRGFKRFMIKQQNLFAKVRIGRQIYTDFKDIKKRVQEMDDRCRRFGLADMDSIVSGPTSTLAMDPRLMLSYEFSSDLVGLDGPRNELIKLLLIKEEEDEEPESAARVKVISIVGSGGLGKTTLARVVYCQTKVYFDYGVWVSVSPKPNVKNILIDVLHQCRRSPHEGELDERELIDNIRIFLQDKRYLIVMDDIWDRLVWDIIRSALPMNSLGSRIIVTTRINSVAESCCSHWNDHIYNIQPLSLKDSRLLFHKRIFGSEEECPPYLLDVSDQILNKCSGLPLAIITMSSLLASRPLDKPIWKEVYDSIGATPERMEVMKSIFLLSYYVLPQHLKVCFLYLSIFPEDYPINRDRVVRSWIAEGFICSKHEITAEEVGESYFNELINRNMIHPVHGSYDVKPEAYLIHGIMHELIKSKSIEENFVTLLGNGKHVPVLHGKIRRLSIINISEDYCIPELEDKSHIRSLYIFGSVGLNLSFRHFIFLRVLDLEGCTDSIDHIIEEVPRLFLLRYLSLRGTNISKLPDQIGRLQSLETLDLRCTEVQELPTSIVQLRMLAHLLCDKIRFPEGIGSMTALSCLSQVDILQSNINAVKELGNLSELRELMLWWFPDIESNNILRKEQLAVSLYRLDKLESLYIHGGDCSVDVLDCLHHPLRKLRIIQMNRSCYVNRIPGRFSDLLPSLAYLCIDISEVKNEDLHLLSELPLLQQLSLSSKAMPTEKLVIRSKGFQILRKFQLHPAKEDLIFEPRAMKNLEELVLSFQVVPEDFHISIGHFTCLKKIDIRINVKHVAASQLFESVDVAIRKAADEHPNHPIVNITALGNLIGYETMEGNEREEKLELVKDK